MATRTEDPRSVSRVVRTEGKNISKLIKIFDSSEAATIFDDNSLRKTGGLLSSSNKLEIMSENQRPNYTLNTQNSVLENGIVAKRNSLTQCTESFSTSNEVSQLNNVRINSDFQNSSESLSDVPFCKKVTNGSLWENVDIGVERNKTTGLWNSADASDSGPGDGHGIDNGHETLSSGSSTAELHNLIASSRSELSKLRDPSMHDKSNLENYFTSFENSKLKTQEPSNINGAYAFHGDQLFFNSDLTSPYDCDINNMSFDDEEATLSDISSDEEMRGHPALANTNYLPAYALHTIIEESCEESERDSRTATPTNNTETSKLERYFSWDIINDAELSMRKKDDDESTIYSDSLSEGSVGDSPKDVDPTQLVSSRLEKYFTSGLVDDQNYFYPDDAEFSEDPPVSDFEEDSIHQKISRSALLSSLETKPDCQTPIVDESTVTSSSSPVNVPSTPEYHAEVKSCISTQSSSICDKNEDVSENSNQSQENSDAFSNCAPVIRNINLESVDCSHNAKNFHNSDELNNESTSDVAHELSVSKCELPKDDKSSSVLPIDLVKNENSCKHLSNKQQIADDIQSIIQKLVSHFSVSPSDSLKNNMETDYTSAWQILETEIDRLLNTISPSALEHNSCNSSMVDSNNSDYGSDTIESVDCMTDEDECADLKNRGKCPLVDIFKPYKMQADCDLSAFNISDETLGIWKRLIQSLQRDNVVLAKNRTCDPNAEARLYIKNQIVTLMHTVTVNDNNVSEMEKASDPYFTRDKETPPAEEPFPAEINEAFNVSFTNSKILVHLPENSVAKTESSDEGISSTDSNENIHCVSDTTKSNQIVLENEKDSRNGSDEINCFLPLANSTQICDDLCTASDKESIGLMESASCSEINAKTKVHDRKVHGKEGDLKFSVFVDIELEEGASAISERKSSDAREAKNDDDLKNIVEKLTSPDADEMSSSNETLSTLRKEHKLSHSAKSQRNHEIGYFSYKSCDDSLINSSGPSSELLDVPNFKSLKRSVKKFPPPSSTLSKSTNNILQNFSVPDAKFSTLQLKSKKSKSAGLSPSRQFTSLFSPSSVFKKITGSKSNETQKSESPIPAKYLKKYARSSSENENLYGAVSMPHLNSCKPGDSYSALGLYSENEPDNSLTVDDEVDARRYFSGSQSVLSLGSHSASMTSVYSAGGGCHYGYVTVSGDVLFGLNYNQKSQMMEVFVKQCRNLAAIDTRHNKSNPYVKLYLLPDKTRSGKRKTKTKKNTLNPVFNELLRFPVLKNELECRTLWLSVWNSDLFGKNDFLGEISLPLGYRLLDSPTLRWYPLQERAESLTSPLNYRGELFIALKYVPRDLSLESRFRPAPVISLRGALHVLVKEARNISANNSGALDAFCKSYLLPDKSKSSKQKTPIVRKSRHPKWYYTVIYEDLSVEDLRERSLELTVWDHDKITSNDFMGGVRLNTGSGLYHGVPVEWMDARRDESSLWEAMLQSPNMWVDGCLPLRPTLQSSHHS